MDYNNISEKLKHILEEVLEIEKDKDIDFTKELSEYGLDSLKVVHLVVMLESEFDIDFEDDELLFDNFIKFENIINKLRGKVSL